MKPTEKCTRTVVVIGLGLGMVSVEKLIKENGDKTNQVVKDNPYVLIEKIKNFAFLKSDKIALRLGLLMDSPFRIKAGLLLYLP